MSFGTYFLSSSYTVTGPKRFKALRNDCKQTLMVLSDT